MTTVDERFWSKVRKTETCWLWTASKTWDGYGQFARDGRLVKAHRWSWEQLRGPIPDGLVIDHLCRVRACVKPDHMEVVTIRENTNRGRSANRDKTCCPAGHSYAGDNLYVNPDGERICRACRNEGKRKSRRGRKAEVSSTFSPLEDAPA